ncbi:hypothetical protein GF359_06395 [candidate division WOR-3 bacterium]|uniref:Terminase large subunit gp17-like C-terminal domain-containing protein n=1 Tax=candidate division WOR-3 bacterium TaxID=2052148 RepID=A0A9D5QCM1_UNCW3|nr:hypothetical protein [candidate division WOR-3 bacterium]MBD3364828.1 hypothetical protein [candidate division WOR-3 bacterium]
MATEDRTLLGRFLERLRERAPLLARYRNDPALFFSERGVRFFDEFERLFTDLYSLNVDKTVLLAPRGGGKTFGAALLATAFFLFRDFDVGIVAGSETQALTLFSYISEWLELKEIEGAVERLRRSDLVGVQGNRIVARTASARSIRGLHLGRGKRGALLIIDEEAEADEAVVRAARYTVRTANPPVILRSSTYHKLTGSFAELVEDHRGQGYELYRWDSFDIASGCRYECEKCPVPEFRESYCKGKAKRAEGWIDIDQIAGEWEDSSREAFEVEVMGMRPSSSGCVITPEAIDRAIVKKEAIHEVDFGRTVCYGCSGCYGGVDWGFAGMTAVVVLGVEGDTVNVLYTEAFHRLGVDAIVERLKELRERFGLREVYADSSHPFENSRLRDEGFAVWGTSSGTLGVPFVSFKEEGVAILSYLFEKDRIEIPEKHTTLIRQLRTWRRDQHGHIVKRNDHFPDALIAAMMKMKIMGVGGGRKPRLYTSSRRFF